MLPNNRQQVPERHFGTSREDHDSGLAQHRGSESSHERPAPQSHWGVFRRPLSGIVSQEDLKGEIDKNHQCHVILAETLVQKFQARDTIVGLEPDLGDQMHEDDGLDVSQFQHVPHALVDVHDAIPLPGPFFFLEQRQTQGHNQVRPAPNIQVRA